MQKILQRIYSFFIFNAVPKIILRGFVRDSFVSGIFSVDLAVPIGRGQRQLLLGDRAKGKSSLIQDIILGNNFHTSINSIHSTTALTTLNLSIYVSIGRRQTEIILLFLNIQKISKELNGLLLGVNGGSADVAPFQWFAPFVGACFGEYFIYSGLDAVIFINDLSRHANSYRQISLLLRRPPAREAFPGDIFFLHARLLERCAKVGELLGSGSCTGIPVVETQGSELSAYIPTNIISITDGQLFLDPKLFNSGTRPAINIGLSVSRIGSAAQITIIKQVSKGLRLEIALHKELDKNRQFKDQLDAVNREDLIKGDFMLTFFQQPKGIPSSVILSVGIITNIGNTFFSDLYRRGETINTIAIKQIKSQLHFLQTGLCSNTSFSVFAGDWGVYADLIIQAAGYAPFIADLRDSCILHTLFAQNDEKRDPNELNK